MLHVQSLGNRNLGHLVSISATSVVVIPLEPVLWPPLTFCFVNYPLAHVNC
jgi:hypothetical protein